MDHLRQQLWPMVYGLMASLVSLYSEAAEEGVVDLATYDQKVWPFLETHCTRCHGETKTKGGLNLEELPEEFIAGSRDARLWQEVMDRLNLGEMPPEEVNKRPPQPEVDEVNNWILTELRRAITNSRDGAGHVVLRRLNREEYNYTVQDLLSLDAAPADLFPADDTAHGFDNIGRALTMSPLLMEKYINAAGELLDQAIVTGEQPKAILRHVEIEDLSRHFTRQKTLRTFHGGFMVRSHDFLLMTKAKTWLPMIDSYKFKQNGIYIFRVKASAVSGGDYPPRMELDFDGTKIWEGDVSTEPKVYEVRVPVKVSNSGGRRVFKIAYSNFNHQHTMPLALDYMEIEGPVYDQWPPEPHQRIFFRGTDAEQTSEYAGEVIKRFATRAFRRPLKDEEIENLMKLYSVEKDAGGSFEIAIKTALASVLCSPDFLFLVEPNSQSQRKLNSFELAARLSYFLWRSMPDKQLFAAAERGADLEAQIDRMLDDPKSQRFVKTFVGQWLQTRLVGSFPPDEQLYPHYDYHLETSMIRETESFFAEILRHDLSVLNFIDSEFTMLNERLARHYGIAGVKGDHMQRVSLPASANRGGVMTHASMLTGLSDGTDSKPIKRGVWILENLLGDPPPPPPPNAGEVEPNKKGEPALSLRERMKHHRQNPACASCHKKIDPLGFSLENFDAVGAWRTHERDIDQPIDASGKLPNGAAFSGPDEFKKILLREKDAFCRCLTEKMLTFALGRGLEVTDRELVEKLTQNLQKNGYRMSELIKDIVRSDAFQSK